MPLYEYQCEACGQRFEIIQKFSDPPAETCRVCSKGPVRRLLSSPAIQFKGSGWYITDYSQKGKPPSSDGAGDGAKSEGKDGSKDASKEAAPGAKSTTDSTPAAPAAPAKSDAPPKP